MYELRGYVNLVKRKEINTLKENATQVYIKLSQIYPDAHCTLNYHSPFELLIMTILASQCTDERVNQVCQTLFKKLKSPSDYIHIGQKQLETLIRPVGFYRNKAKHIIETCKILIEKYNGEVPKTMDELLSLSGVGRKTANVILGECFKTPGIIVDTHCGRLAKRLGFTQSDNPNKVELDLMKLLPPENWTFFSHLLVFHGRNICHARKPKCNECIICDLCDFYKSQKLHRKEIKPYDKNY